MLDFVLSPLKRFRPDMRRLQLRSINTGYRICSFINEKLNDYDVMTDAFDAFIHIDAEETEICL